MRISEAAAVLGVSSNADKQTIEKAARQQIRKWHPDKWRNASEAEQKKAAEEYSKVSKAQQTMLHPDTADPEPHEDMPSSTSSAYSPSAYSQQYASQQQVSHPTYQTGGGFPNGFDVDASFNPQSQYRPQPQQVAMSDSTSQGTSAFDSMFQDATNDNQRMRYNTATDFTDTFGAVPDTMEQTLNTMHNANITKQYKQIADIMKISMSLFASVMWLISSIIMVLYNDGQGIVGFAGLVASGFGKAMSDILPPTSGSPTLSTFGILALLALVKIFVYDMLIAPLVTRNVSVVRPSLLCGIDFILCGIIGYAVSSLWTLPRFLYGFMILIGILVTTAAVLVKLYRDTR